MDYQTELQNKVNAGIYQLATKRKGKSAIWTLFAEITKQDGTVLHGYVCCCSCRKLFKYNGKHSSNLNRHKCYTKAVSLASPVKVNDEDKKATIDACSAWVVEDCRPFSAIMGSGFQKLVEFFIKIGSRYGENVDVNDLLPDATTLSRRLQKNADEEKKKLSPKIAKVVDDGDAALTIDFWQDDFVKRNFLCATFHCQEQFQMKDIVLGMKSMDLARTTGDNIHSKLESLLAEFAVSDMRKIAFVTDQKSDVIRALEGYTRLNSSSHLFNSVLDAAFEATSELTEIISNCKKLVKYLKKANLQLNTSPKTPCPAQWNSHYLLFKSIVDNWPEITGIPTKSIEISNISSKDLVVLQCLVKLCGDFEFILKKLQGCRTPSICFVIPSINCLKRICGAKDSDVLVIAALKANILRALDAEWSANLNIRHKAAYFLYPPAKGDQINDWADIKAFCIQEMSTLQPTAPSTAAQATASATPSVSSPSVPPSPDESHASLKKDESLFFFPQLLRRRCAASAIENAADEVARYCEEQIFMDDNFDVMQWWKENGKKYPNLSKVALRILAIPASSAASEKVFSLAANIITEKRCRLAPRTVDNIMFLYALSKSQL